MPTITARKINREVSAAERVRSFEVPPATQSLLTPKECPEKRREACIVPENPYQSPEASEAKRRPRKLGVLFWILVALTIPPAMVSAFFAACAVSGLGGPATRNMATAWSLCSALLAAGFFGAAWKSRASGNK